VDPPWIFKRHLLDGHRVGEKLFTKGVFLASPIKGQGCCRNRDSSRVVVQVQELLVWQGFFFNDKLEAGEG